eukprot:5227222-Karenia_brevis.AAC.1
MVGCGFVQGKYSPSTYYHREKDLKTLVHGDDFVTSGRREETEWFREQLKKRFQIKSQTIGDGEGEVREGKVLNRIIRKTDRGWEYEADQRHVDIL